VRVPPVANERKDGYPDISLEAVALVPRHVRFSCACRPNQRLQEEGRSQAPTHAEVVPTLKPFVEAATHNVSKTEHPAYSPVEPESLSAALGLVSTRHAV